jgi:hypothetical protein
MLISHVVLPPCTCVVGDLFRYRTLQKAMQEGGMFGDRAALIPRYNRPNGY